MRETNHAVIVDAIRIPIGRRKSIFRYKIRTFIDSRHKGLS